MNEDILTVWNLAVSLNVCLLGLILIISSKISQLQDVSEKCCPARTEDLEE